MISAEIVKPEGMTKAEGRVLEKLCEGLSTKAIAKALCVSANTIETHIDHLYQKNGITLQSINRRTTLIITAISKGVIKITLNSALL